jgi:phenylacetic acid degradation operon negative regulatory protein
VSIVATCATPAAWVATTPRRDTGTLRSLTAGVWSCYESVVSETTVGGATGASAGSIGDVDLPTRMLVFGTARLDGSIPAAEVFAAAHACQRSAEQVRSCLRRLVAEGLFVRDGVGQRATYRPTDAGLRALVDFGGRAFQAHVQDTAAATGWDGEWHLVAFAVPEARRTARDALRDHLGRLGGAPIHNGLYVSPHPWDKDVAGAAAELDVREHVTLARTEHLSVGGVSDPRDLAARLWPVAEVAAGYRSFVDRWSPARDHLTAMHDDRVPLPDSAFLPAALAMALAYRSCLDADPLLPGELLPRPWPGRAARKLLVDTRRLALGLRAGTGRPVLFATFDDLLATLPGRAPTDHPDPGPGPGDEHAADTTTPAKDAADRRSPGGTT